MKIKFWIMIIGVVILIVGILFLLKAFDLLDISRLTTIPSSGSSSAGGGLR